MNARPQSLIASFIVLGVMTSSAWADSRKTIFEGKVNGLDVQVETEIWGYHESMDASVIARIPSKRNEPSLLEMEKACYSSLIRAELAETEKGRQFELKSFLRSQLQWQPSLLEVETKGDRRSESIHFRLIQKDTREIFEANARVTQGLDRTLYTGQGGEQMTRLIFLCKVTGIEIKGPRGNPERISTASDRQNR